MDRTCRTVRLRAAATIILLGVAVLTACQSGPPQISIADARAELSMTTIGEAEVYLKIVNQGGADMITGVRTNIPGATASFHVMQGKRMVAVDMMNLHAKRTLEFASGGEHIMIANMAGTMNEGSTFTLTLVFQQAGEKQVPLTLQKASPTMTR